MSAQSPAKPTSVCGIQIQRNQSPSSLKHPVTDHKVTVTVLVKVVPNTKKTKPETEAETAFQSLIAYMDFYMHQPLSQLESEGKQR